MASNEDKIKAAKAALKAVNASGTPEQQERLQLALRKLENELGTNKMRPETLQAGRELLKQPTGSDTIIVPGVKTENLAPEKMVVSADNFKKVQEEAAARAEQKAALRLEALKNKSSNMFNIKKGIQAEDIAKAAANKAENAYQKVLPTFENQAAKLPGITDKVVDAEKAALRGMKAGGKKLTGMLPFVGPAILGASALYSGESPAAAIAEGALPMGLQPDAVGPSKGSDEYKMETGAVPQSLKYSPEEEAQIRSRRGYEDGGAIRKQLLMKLAERK